MYILLWAFLVAQTVKNLPAIEERQLQYLGWEDLLGKGMATHPRYKHMWWNITQSLKEWNDVTCGNTDTTRDYTKWSELEKDKYIIYIWI